MRVTWYEAQRACEDMRSLLSGFRYIYGIPSGGIPVMLMLSPIYQLGGHHEKTVPMEEDPRTALGTVTEAVQSCLIVDDIVDSGKTIAPYLECGFRCFSLFSKDLYRHDRLTYWKAVDEWVEFPWENRGSGPEDAVRRLLQFIGEDPKRDGLIDTPRRVLKSWQERTAGYLESPVDILSTRFDAGYDQMVTVRNIEFYSTCEHHLLPFSGEVAIGYIPKKGKVVGLSKLARLVECYAKRLQIQERMTEQIANAIGQYLTPEGVGVIVRAHHLCMGCRGVKKPTSDAVTSVVTGSMRTEPAARAEFFNLVFQR